MHSHPSPEPDDDVELEAALPRPPSFPYAVFFFVWGLSVIVAGMVTLILPESFSSTTRISLSRDQTDIAGLVVPETPIAYDPYYIQTEFELMQSEIVLRKVVDELDLNTVWGKKYANGERLKTSESLQMLKRRIDLRPVRNTSLIGIQAFSERPDEAAKVANAVAEAYQEYRRQARISRITDGMRALEAAYEENNAQVIKLETELADLQGKHAPQDISREADVRRRLDDFKRFGQTLFTKLAAERTDLALPAATMVQIVDRAAPSVKPVRPNTPLNIIIGIVVGGLGGLLLASLLYLIQRRAYRRAMGIGRTPYPPRFRAIAHILIALMVGVIVGYNCAMPLQWSSIITVPLTLLLGAVASAYIELANPAALPASSAMPNSTEPREIPRKY